MTGPPRPAFLVTIAATALALAACSGGGGGGSGPTGAAAGPNGAPGRTAGGGPTSGVLPSGGPGGPGPVTGADVPITGAPLPKVRTGQVKPLVGKWVGNGQAQDYFVFRADGTGTWIAHGRTLWAGQVIPDGPNRFRFSWEGTDPQEASFWGVTLDAGGERLVFGGTNQTYTKAAS